MTEAGYLRTLSESGVCYSEAVLLQNPSYRHPFEKITLETERSLYLERRPQTTEQELTNLERCDLVAGRPPERLSRFERIESGLAEYF